MRTKTDLRLLKEAANDFLFLIFLSIGCFFGSSIVSAATPPAIFSYQGKLLSGGNVASSTEPMEFVLYNDPTSGSAVYTAAGTTSSPSPISITPTTGGLFVVNFGAGGTNPVDPSIFQNNTNLYLEVTIGSGPSAETLVPRKQITTAPFAFNAQYLQGYGVSVTPSSTGYIPVADSSGNFNFNHITSTGITAGTSSFTSITLNGVTQRQWDTNFIGTTVATTTGNFSFNGQVGYQAANQLCAAFIAGSHFCRTSEVIATINDAASLQGLFITSTDAWIAQGPPGYIADANDCNGYTTSSFSVLGAFWRFNPVGGGAGYLSNCSVGKPVACCQ